MENNKNIYIEFIGFSCIGKTYLRDKIYEVIEDENKFFYYRGLKEYPRVIEFLTDTCLSAQDDYLKMVEYFTNK